MAAMLVAFKYDGIPVKTSIGRDFEIILLWFRTYIQAIEGENFIDMRILPLGAYKVLH